jgi:hypothetical protein
MQPKLTSIPTRRKAQQPPEPQHELRHAQDSQMAAQTHLPGKAQSHSSLSLMFIILQLAALDFPNLVVSIRNPEMSMPSSLWLSHGKCHG